MRISFIVPAYNVGPYIQECIDSLLNQNNPVEGTADVEVIVVNDGSTDNTAKQLEKYQDDERVKVIHTVNQGVSTARNTGIDQASGDWLFFVDGDDVVSSDLLKDVYPSLNDSENDLCFVQHFEWKKGAPIPSADSVDTIEIDRGDFKEFIKATLNRDIAGKYDYHQLKMATPCKFYRRDLIEKQGIRFDPVLKLGEDAVFNIQVYKAARKASYLPSLLYYHRILDSSVSHRYNPSATRCFDDLHKALQNELSDDSSLSQYLADRYMWSIGFCCVLDFNSKNNPKTYREHKSEFEKYRQKYIDATREYNPVDFRFKKRILMELIRRNMFWAIDLILRRIGGVSI